MLDFSSVALMMIASFTVVLKLVIEASIPEFHKNDVLAKIESDLKAKRDNDPSKVMLFMRRLCTTKSSESHYILIVLQYALENKACEWARINFLHT